MADTVFVNISGPVFAFLLYENVKSSGNQEGFFIGDISENKTSFATDSNINNVTVDKIINIRDVLPCPRVHEFYNNVGVVNKEKLDYFLQDKRNQVVGWFHFRRNTNCIPFLREKLVHKAFCALFNKPPELFSICILTIYTKNCSIYDFVHSFFRYNYIKFEEIPFQIENLGDADNLYKSSTSSIDFNMLITKLSADSKNLKDVQIINKILIFIEKHLQDLVGKVSKTDKEVFCLENQVKDLQKQIYSIKYGHESEKIEKEKLNKLQNLICSSNASCNFNKDNT